MKHEEYRAGQEAELLMDDIQSVISEQEEPVMPSSEIEKDASETEAETSENTEQVETLPAELSKVMQVFH